MRVSDSMEWLKDTGNSIFPSVPFTVLICALIIMTCLSGDHMLTLVSDTDWSGNGHVIRAMADSLTHAIVGALVWAVAENSEPLNDLRKWRNCIFCAFLAALVDFDHFLAAGSMDLRKALSLTRRPYFHNTSLIPVVVVSCLILRQYIPALQIFSLMFLSSWLSHHLRDANHRGLWLFPFGHTPVFSSYLYIALILFLALSVRIMHYTTFNVMLRNNLSTV